MPDLTSAGDCSSVVKEVVYLCFSGQAKLIIKWLALQKWSVKDVRLLELIARLLDRSNWKISKIQYFKRNEDVGWIMRIELFFFSHLLTSSQSFLDYITTLEYYMIPFPLFYSFD